MEAKKLYAILEKDFITSAMSDEWAARMTEVQDFLSDNFKKRSMGLVCDFAENITHVYCAVFPEKSVMEKIIEDGAHDALLFVHHPAIWDIRKAPAVFQQMDRKLLEEFKKRKIAIYNLHVPLDNFGPYSTSNTLAEALGIKVERACSPYFGGLAGVIGTTSCKTTAQLGKLFENAVGHPIKRYDYGKGKIANGKVVVVAGGGNEVEYLKEAFDEGVNTVITGISSRNSHSEKEHSYEDKHGINVLGGTHYSTERFACEKMCNYFDKLGLKSEFVSGVPVMEDM